MSRVQFPEMRAAVLESLRSLSDRAYQVREWGQVRSGKNRYDDLALSIHILYDDTAVLPDPMDCVGSILLTSDVEPLRRLAEVLDPMIDDLDDGPDAAYLADPRWAGVLQAAASALQKMERSGPS